MKQFAAAAGLAACLMAAGTAIAQTDKVELSHIDVTNVDKAADPCTNFYRYACGRINAENPIPPDQVAWGPSGKLNLWNRQVLRSILEADAVPSASRTPNQQKIGDFYASCVQQAESGADDFAVLRPLLAEIDAMKSRRDFAVTVEHVQTAFGKPWNASDNQTDVALFGFGQTPDANDVSHVIAGFDQGGLGLPGRDFYLGNDAHSQEIRESYRKLVETMLAKSGMSPEAARAGAATVLRLETALATAQMDNITRRDPNATNNKMSLAQFKTLLANFDTGAYLAAMGAPAVPVYEVSAPKFFTAVNSMLASEDMNMWKVYLRWQLLASAAPTLGNGWRDAQFAFAQKLTGAKVQAPAWRRCSQAVDANLGEALGQVYVEQVFSPESKARVLKMVKQIEAAMGRDIDAATWMQPATREQAKLKLTAIVEKIGYPDKWIDYTPVTITRDSYPRNVERANAFELKRQLGFIGHPLDRTQWGMTPPTLNAYEDPQTNTINFPAGILQPPFFDPKQDDVVNYGAEGAVIGHELTHDFDDQGRKFDLHGNLKDWWTPEDARLYEERGSCIAKEYTGPVPNLDGVTQNGKLTQGEDTADNGGLYLALSALSEDLKAQGKSLGDTDANGLTNMQRFFLAFANDWCGQTRPEAERVQVMTNPHSVRELRVNNTVGNMPEFAKAFGCKAGQTMVHAPSCRVW